MASGSTPFEVADDIIRRALIPNYDTRLLAECTHPEAYEHAFLLIRMLFSAAMYEATYESLLPHGAHHGGNSHVIFTRIMWTTARPR